jgi:hypothetical protein
MCVLRVTGRKFDPAKHLASSTLTPYSVFRAGEPKLGAQTNGQKHEVSGFNVEVSRASWTNLAVQAADAVAFLQKHRRSLTRLRRIREVEDIWLDFPLDLRIDRKTVFAQFDYFPPKLISLAGGVGCGLGISIYPRDLEQLAQRRRGVRRTGSETKRRRRR